MSVYLIEHPKGDVLVDTGWHEDIRTQQRRHLGWLSHSMFQGDLPLGQSVGERLREQGKDLNSLHTVVLTHMHADHVSGLKHVEEARRIIVSEEEWKAAHKEIGYRKSMWEGVAVDPLPLEVIPYGPFCKGIDLFNDGTVYLVHTPGHSRGQWSVLVQTVKGWLLLASDVGYAVKSWEEGHLPGLMVDHEAAVASLDWVKSFSKREDCYAVLANHDADVREGRLV